MAFAPIPSTVIEAGDPVTQELWTTTKDNFDNHETRIASLEGGSNVVYVPLQWNVSGPYAYSTPAVNMGVLRLTFDIQILAGRLLIHNAGTSGGTEIDFLYKRGANPWTSIFATKPSVLSSAGNYAISTNGVLSVTSLLAGDLIRMDITAAQGGPIGAEAFGLTGIIEFEKD